MSSETWPRAIAEGRIVTSANRSPILVGPVVKEALKLLRASMPSTVELRQEISDEADVVHADPTQIHQIVMNLCTNAYQAVGAGGGVLEVSLRAIDVDAALARRHLNLRQGPYVAPAVRDTGPGIAPAAVKQIYEPFFTTKPVGQGVQPGTW